MDVWSVGCIFAEMLGRRPLLPGKDYIDQLKLTIQKLGSPTDDDLHFITNTAALKVIQTMGNRFPRIDWSIRYPKTNVLALDLLDKMLQFNPNKRISVVDALAHPWLTDYAAPHDEPVSRPIDPHDWAFDVTTTPLSKSEIQGLMLKEMEFFRPTNDRLRPQSTRLAALGRATSNATTVTNTSGNNNNNDKNDNGSKHVSPPVNTTNNETVKKETKTLAKAVTNNSVATGSGVNNGIDKYTKNSSSSSSNTTTVNSIAAILAMATKEGNTNNVSYTVKSTVVQATAPNPPPVLPNPTAAVPEANKVSTVTTSSNTDLLLAALLDQMKGFRQDLLLSIDQRTRMVEKQFEARLEPILNKLSELENKMGNTTTTGSK